MLNKELKEIYDACYEEGQEKFHSHLPLDLIYSEVYKIIKNFLNDKRILDLGCGDGTFLRKYATLEEPKRMVGYDFSETGIKKAKEDPITEGRNIKFDCVDFKELEEKIKNSELSAGGFYDIITSIGVIEHLDEPEKLFYLANFFLKPGGWFILEHPNFLNTRGIVWKILEIFLGAEMSKTDKHALLPDEIFSYIEKYEFECKRIITFDHDRGMYSDMLEDFSKRLKD